MVILLPTPMCGRSKISHKCTSGKSQWDWYYFMAHTLYLPECCWERKNDERQGCGCNLPRSHEGCSKCRNVTSSALLFLKNAQPFGTDGAETMECSVLPSSEGKCQNFSKGSIIQFHVHGRSGFPQHHNDKVKGENKVGVETCPAFSPGKKKACWKGQLKVTFDCTNGQWQEAGRLWGQVKGP